MSSTIDKLRELNERAVSMSRGWLGQLHPERSELTQMIPPEIMVVSLPEVARESKRDTVTADRGTDIPIGVTVDMPQLEIRTPMNRSIAQSNAKAAEWEASDANQIRVDSNTKPVRTEPRNASQNEDEPATIVSLNETSVTALRPEARKMTEEDGVSTEAHWFQFDEPEDSKIQRLADQVIRQFPPVAPAVLMFVSTEPTEFVEMTIARIASCLAGRSIGKVLLVDGNGDEARLTRNQLNTDATGLADATNRDVHWKDCVLETKTANLSFLPAGSDQVSVRKCNHQSMRSMANQFKNEFKYVCINAGRVGNPITTALCGSCDGTFLVLSLEQTEKAEAHETVEALQTHHARLLGTIIVEPSSL